MNKYQKALDYLAENSMFETVEHGGESWKEVTHEGIEAQELLQELVDRATRTPPKKVVDKPPFKAFGWCPSCNYSINRRNHPKFCGNCSASLDWSEEND